MAKIIVIMPAYNAEKTLKKTYQDIPKDWVDEIILVDDASQDKTAAISKSLGLVTVVHDKNKGYGANQKTCYQEALKRGAEIIVMIHPDYQYDARLLPELVKPILDDRFDLMLGSRIRTRQEALASGMPFYKYLANRFLTIFENMASGQNLSEWHTGLRAYRKEFFETVPFMSNSNDFVFDTEILFQAIHFKFKIGEISVPAKYFAEASSINFKRSCEYGLETLLTLGKFLLQKSRIKKFKIFKPTGGDY